MLLVGVKGVEKRWWEWSQVGGTLQKVYSKHSYTLLQSPYQHQWHTAQTHCPWLGILGCFWPNWVDATCLDWVFYDMRKRLIQIFGFLITSLGWLFVLCTMAMDFWRISQIGGQGGSFIIKVAWYWSNLWKDCFSDSTAVTNCRDFGVLWAVTRKLSTCWISLSNDSPWYHFC